jgi:hypothetical protein
VKPHSKRRGSMDAAAASSRASGDNRTTRFRPIAPGNGSVSPPPWELDRSGGLFAPTVRKCGHPWPAFPRRPSGRKKSGPPGLTPASRRPQLVARPSMARISSPPVRAEEKRPSRPCAHEPPISPGSQAIPPVCAGGSLGSETNNPSIQRGVARIARAGLGSERRQDAESEAGRERAKAWRAIANVRRRGTGNPEPRHQAGP